jgi:predicted dehydrogenase
VEKIRVLLVGCGGFMRHRLNNLLPLPEIHVIGLCEPSTDQIRLTRTAHPVLSETPAFDRLELGLGMSPDAVVIATPHTQHVSQIEASFAAGAHVLVEKPLSTSVADCRRCIAARDKAGKIGAVSYQRHGSPVFQELRAICADRRYGNLLMFNSHLAQDWLRLTKGSWRQDMSLSGGGQINDSGSHMIDILLWATGDQASEVTSYMDNRESEVDINSVVNIRFDSGAMGSLTIIGDAPMWQERHAFWFEEGAVFIQDDRMEIQDRQGRHTVIDQWAKPAVPDANFVDAILGRAEVAAPFECGLNTIALTEAAWVSTAQGGAPTKVERVLPR